MIVDDPLEQTIRPVLPMGPLRIQLERPLSEREFWRLCQQNDDEVLLEQNPDGTLVITPPHGGTTGSQNAHVTRHLADWNEENGTGVGFAAGTMFRLRNSAKRMPDTAWIQRERYLDLSEDEREGIVPLAPDFVVELRSPSDGLDVLKNKMNEYLRAGVRLGWLIDPQTETVTIYRRDGSTETLDRPETVNAETVVEGFTLPMARIWDPLGESDS